MSTVKTFQIDSISSDATEQFAEKLGSQLKGGEVVELISDLGGGKTTFVRGLAKGMGSTDHVASPTFMISKIYQGRTLELHHFDFYRLNDAGLLEHELYDIINDPKAVLVVEWGDIVQHVLPSERLSIRISRIGEETRRLEFTYPKELSYLVELLC